METPRVQTRPTKTKEPNSAPAGISLIIPIHPPRIARPIKIKYFSSFEGFKLFTSLGIALPVNDRVFLSAYLDPNRGITSMEATRRKTCNIVTLATSTLRERAKSAISATPPVVEPSAMAL